MPTTPQDHKKPAAQVEAENAETIVITWRDHKFTIPATPEGWDIDTLDAFEAGRAVDAVRGVLGREQWAEFRKVKPRVPELREVGDLIAEAMGFEDSGE